MSENTGIEWAGSTWNCIIGCTHASKGCLYCYAEGQVHRFGERYDRPTTIKLGRKAELLTRLPVDQNGKTLGKGAQWTGAVWLLPDVLELPLRRKKPTTYFVNSLADWAHESIVESEQGRQFLAAMFGVMAATPQHTYQLLTKRPEQARKWFEWLGRVAPPHRRHTYATACAFEFIEGTSKRKMSQSLAEDEIWPLPNVWLGCSVEDQATADERIPALLDLPAAVRFISAEPLLGPIDLSRWIEAIDRCSDCEAERPARFEDHCDECGDDGTMLTTWGAAQLERLRSGERYADDGSHADDDGPQLAWVIVGGESGPKARPCDVAWIRSIVEQCKGAGVSCFVKQLGARPVVEQEDCPTCAGEAVDLDAMLDHEETCDYAGHDILDEGGGECTTCGVTLPPCSTCGPYHGRTPPTLHLADAKGGNMSEWPEDLRVREVPR